MLFPFVWMVSTALKSPIDIFSLDIIPENITFSNYVKVMEESLFAKWFVNSLIIATVTTISVAFFDTLVGYIIAKFAFVGRGVLFVLILSTLMVPTEMLDYSVVYDEFRFWMDRLVLGRFCFQG